ncbi:MAG: hypothetical protein WCR29_05215 [Bacteroidales bacterium]
MGNFSIRVVYDDGTPAQNINVFVSYSGLGGHDEEYTDSDGWTEFDNYGNDYGAIYVDGDKIGEYDLSDDSSYSFTI